MSQSAQKEQILFSARFCQSGNHYLGMVQKLKCSTIQRNTRSQDELLHQEDRDVYSAPDTIT